MLELWPFGVTWRHRSRDHWTRNRQFPIGDQLQPYVYLARLRRYRASNILGSRPWLFGVTCGHRSRDHWTRNIWFPISDSLKPPLCLAQLLRYCMPNIEQRLITIKNAVITILGSRGANQRVKVFLGLVKSPRHVFWATSRHYRSSGVLSVLLEPSHWKCITGRG